MVLAGCSGKTSSEAGTTPPATASTAVVVPNEVGKTLDKAQKELEGLGFKVRASDAVEDKTVVVKSNWEVISQDPAAGSSAVTSSTITLGVKHNTSAPSPTSTPSPTPTVQPGAADTATGAGTGGGAGSSDGNSYVNSQPAPQAPNVGGGTIVCKDGYIWPGTTRQGACHGHGGIR
ncbi:PASTA domain-containing protein [Sinomonas terricola]|uniref:PASTA domain-containing protein n=1 Tax=Sinomonas terricola TaxID=3110330 RepID=UPI003D16E4A0